MHGQTTLDGGCVRNKDRTSLAAGSASVKLAPATPLIGNTTMLLEPLNYVQAESLFIDWEVRALLDIGCNVLKTRLEAWQIELILIDPLSLLR